METVVSALRGPLVVLGAAFALVACMPKTGRLESNRFQHDRYPYAVFYADGGSAEAPLGGKDWHVDNYVRGKRGYEPNRAPAYTIERKYALNEDRRAPYARIEYLYDLRLVHAHKDAELMVRTIPLSTATSELDLRVLAARYVDAVADQGSLAPPFGPERADSTGQSATRRSDELSCRLSDRDAYRIDFELPLRTGAGARSPKRGSAVIVRTGYVERVSDGARSAAPYPVLMVIAFAARPEDASVIAPDFDRLLALTVLGDTGMGLSMKGSHTCTRAVSAGDERPAPSQELGE